MEKQCDLCGGTGEMVIPAQQVAGVAVDEQKVVCPCQKEEKEYEPEI